MAKKDPAIQFTDFTASEKALINECFGMDIPFFGTRAFRMEQETVSEMKTLMFQGMFLPTNYLNNFTSNGFELVQDMGSSVYQKVVEDKVYTITFASTGSPLNYYQLVFTKDYPSLKPGEWPSSTINQYLSTDFASFMNDHPFDGTDYSYTGVGMAMSDFDHAVSIILKNDNKDRATIISDVTTYLQHLKDITSNYQFVLDDPVTNPETHYYYLRLHDAHDEHNVAFTATIDSIGTKMVYYLTINQKMTVSEFPVEYIRQSLNLGESFVIDGYNDPGARYYVSYSGGNLLQVYIYDTSATNYANNLQALRDKGYISAKRDLEPNSIYFRKAFFDDYCITARLVEDYYCFDYSYNNSFGELYDNMSDVIERYGLETMSEYVFPEIGGTHKYMYVTDSWEIEKGKVKLASGAYISDMTETEIKSVFESAHYTYDSENKYYITGTEVHYGEQTISLVIELSMYDENTVYLNFKEVYGN